MVNQQHLHVLKQGVSAWNQWRKDHPDIAPDLSRVDLHDISLEGAHLEHAHLDKTYLERAHLRAAHLEHADLVAAHLESADLYEAHLEGATLYEAHLERTILKGANLESANLSGINLEEADLNGAIFKKAEIRWGQLQGANLYGAHLEEAELYGARLTKTNLRKACLEGTDLREVDLREADLREASLRRADVRGAHLEGADLRGTHLEGGNLQLAFFDNTTRLDGICLGDEQFGFVSVADASWDGINLAVVDWLAVKMLGDERTARQTKTRAGTRKDKATQTSEYRVAIRANRQLAVTLRNQGLSEEADQFAYRAQFLRRSFLKLQMLQRQVKLRPWIHIVSAWLFSWFVFLLAGYGYRPLRSIIVYILIICMFAMAYLWLGHLPWYEALVVSLTAFHGRGFFSGTVKPDNPQSFLAASEAVVGLLIEISFVATFTQRFFGK